MIKNEDNKKAINNKEKEKKPLINNSKYKIEIIKDNILNDEIMYKIIIIGNSSVGKTSLTIRLTQNLFEESRPATIGFDIFNYCAKINDIIIKLQIWDTCGLEDFSSCTPSLFKNAALAIVVYSIDDLDSFKNLEKWVNLVRSNGSPDTLIFIVGNKKDLVKKRKIQKIEGEKFKKERKYNFFIEASAKENEFVNELFQEAIIQLYEQYKELQNNEDKGRLDFTKRKESVKLKNIKQKKEKEEEKTKLCC